MLDAAAVSARRIASGTLGASDLHWSGVSSSTLPNELYGVYIPLLVDGGSLQLGVLGSGDVCARLAASLLANTEGGVAGDEDIFDAIGEVTNLIAGDFKVLLAEQINVRVGLPLAMRGRVFPLGGSQSIQGRLTLDGNELWLAMTGPKNR